MATLRRLLSDRTFRRTAFLRTTRPKNLFQPFNDTADDRYPEIFSWLAQAVEGSDRLSVLSFGCSTGAEVFSLRRYLPSADILGLDISRGNVSDCNRRLRRAPDPHIRFVHAGDTSGLDAGSLDIALCMAVFRHGGLARAGTVSCDHLISFHQFESTISDIDRCLRPGGYLAVEHSNFRFDDTSVADKYDCALTIVRPQDPKTPLFDRSNQLVPAGSYGKVIFRKRS